MKNEAFSLTEHGWETAMPKGVLSSYLREKRKKIVKNFVKGDVLDLGCGKADFYELYRDKITSYYGVDIDTEIVKALQAKFPECKFFRYDFDEDTLHFDMKFDCILMVGLIEHLYNQKHIMKQVKNCLKPEGIIVITTPTPLGNDIVHRYGSKINLFSPRAADDHVVIYNKKRFEILAKDIGLKIEKYKSFQLGCNQLVVLKNQE